jgi:hypothetical protein
MIVGKKPGVLVCRTEKEMESRDGENPRGDKSRDIIFRETLKRRDQRNRTFRETKRVCLREKEKNSRKTLEVDQATVEILQDQLRKPKEVVAQPAHFLIQVIMEQSARPTPFPR